MTLNMRLEEALKLFETFGRRLRLSALRFSAPGLEETMRAQKSKFMYSITNFTNLRKYKQKQEA